MVDQRLAAYINEQLKEGYSISAIKGYLIKYGYSPQQIDEAIDQAYKPTVKHVIHLSKTALIAVIVIVFGLAAIGTAIFTLIPKAPAQLLDLKIDVAKPAVEPGDELEFKIELVNLGSRKRYDISLRHSVSDSGNEIIATKEETIALETRASAASGIRIPDDAKPGSYLLKTIASYGDKTARATDSFKVYKEEIEPTCFDNIQNQGEEGIDCGAPCEACKECPASCDDSNKCTEDYCSAATGYGCKYDEIIPCCGNLKCESGEANENCASDCEKEEPGGEPAGMPWKQADEAKELAARDEGGAVELCKGIGFETQKDQCFYNIGEATKKEGYCGMINDERTKDKCYSKVAELNNNDALCEKIARDSRKDSCYMNFVLKGDYSVCGKLNNRYLKQSCESLRDLGEEAS